MKKGKLILFGIALFALIFTLAGCKEQEAPKAKEVSQEDLKIATIEGQDFTQADMNFYTLVQRITHELNRVKDAENLEGEELETSMAYWDEQNKQYDNVNAQLQNMIEIYSMSLLANEKNFFVPEEDLEKELARFQLRIEDNIVVDKMIQDYGDDLFKVNIRQYMAEVMLGNRIVDEIEKEARKEHADASEQEIQYEVNTAYDELYVDQVSGLKKAIYIK